MADLSARLQVGLAGRYTIERELGRGGMAIVYLARDLRHDRAVALKVLRPELSASLGPERFLREIKLAAGLTHPHILPLHDSGEVDGLLYYVMPYVEGESLRDRLVRERTLPLDEALAIAREVADALSYAHSRDVVHRDIKPENILFEAGHAVVSDFGIARAISVAGGQRVTGTGIAVGTPDYMSPEQASGAAEVDGRSDIYSLGCVLYEMLVGHPPFTGLSAQEVFAAHRERQAASLSGARPSIPIEVEVAVERALAKVPADRFRTASEFAAALALPSGGRAPVRRFLALPPRWWAGLATAAVAGAAALALLPRLFLGAGLDRSLYVVVPFGHRGGAAPTLLNGDQCELLLYEAFGRWADVRLVNDLRVHDVRSRRGETPATLREALALARELGSGLLVWGEVGEVGDAIQVRAVLYDVARRGATIRQYAIRFGRDRTDLAEKFNELADSLLLGRARSRAAAAGAMGTRVLAAWQAYEAGHAALSDWDLTGAGAAFRGALALDPAYPHAQLWLAQMLALAGEPTATWRPHATAAATQPASERFGTRDRTLAAALAAVAEGRYAEGCERYERLVARDSLDFWAWFGLGECHARDRLVLRDASSPSGWRFRSSYHAAARAYRTALQIIPSVHRAFHGPAFTRLADLFFTESNVYRAGFALAPDTVSFGAWPGLDHDTLAFVPFPLGDVLSAQPGTSPASRARAVALNREILRTVLLTWLHAFASSPEAHEQLAQVLETTGELAETRPIEHSALALVRRARELAREPAHVLRLAADEVRLLVKLEDFARARALADSLLDAWPRPGASEAQRLAGLAALTGRVHRVAELLRQAAPVETLVTWEGGRVPSPAPVREAALALLGYASLGAPPESVTALERRVARLVGSWVEPERRGRVREAALHVPASLAFPEIGLSAVHRGRAGGNYLLEMQWALARGDSAAVRARFARLRELRRDSRPGDVAIDGTYHEAWLLLALGDSAAAAELLDYSLNALPTLGTELLGQVPQAGALVHAMALRAELAARAGDRATAARWARAVLALWSGADAELGTVVARMNTLAAPVDRE